MDMRFISLVCSVTVTAVAAYGANTYTYNYGGGDIGNMYRSYNKAASDWLNAPTFGAQNKDHLYDSFVFSRSLSSAYYGQQCVLFDYSSYNTPYYLGTIGGANNYRIIPVGGMGCRAIVFRDASNFDGVISGGIDDLNDPCTSAAAYCSGGVIIKPEAGMATGIKNLHAVSGLSTAVSGDGATGIVHNVWGAGHWRPLGYSRVFSEYSKNTTLEIGQRTDSGSMHRIEVGAEKYNSDTATGTVRYHHTDVVPCVPGDPAAHLDASVTNTLTVEDGVVTRWADVRDYESFAAVATAANPGPKPVSSRYSNLPLLSFGGMTDHTAQIAASGEPATMVFEGGAITGIREAFIVFCDQDYPVRPGDNESSSNFMLAQNLLGSAAGAKQYFSRLTSRRAGSGWYLSSLFDSCSFSSNMRRDANADVRHFGVSDVRLDGVRIWPERMDEYTHDIYVVSVGIPTGFSVQADRIAANGYGKIGGLCYGEIIIYTNALTVLERRQLNAYLVNKWKRFPAAEYDFKSVNELAGSSIVPEGSVFRAKDFKTANASIESRANLEIERILGNRPSLMLTEGATNLTLYGNAREAAIVTPAAPPVDPEMWLDANRHVTLVSSNVFGTTMEYVQCWEDSRDGYTNRYGCSFKTCPLSFAAPNKQRLVLDPIGGHVASSAYCCLPTVKTVGANKMVDFGPQRRNEMSYDYMDGKGHTYTDIVEVAGGKLVTNLYDNITECYRFKQESPRDAAALSLARYWANGTDYQGYYSLGTMFFVLQLNDEETETSPGSIMTILFSNRIFSNGDGRVLANEAIGVAPSMADAEWYVNGERVDGFRYVLPVGQTLVIAVRPRSVNRAQFNSLCYYSPGNGSGSWGGLSFGEIITYPCILNEVDMQATEAYLIGKWLGKVHPAIARSTAAVSLGSIQFDADAGSRPVIETERALSVGVLDVGASDAIIKRGEGALDVTVTSSAVKNYIIEEGSYSTAIEPLLDDAYLHFDASCADSVVFRTGQEDERRVDKWMDCRNNGKYAQCLVGTIGKYSLTNATYETSDDSSLGLLNGSKYIDFGTGGGMFWYDAAGTRLEPTMGEMHVVFEITAAGNHPIIGSSASVSTGTKGLVPSGYLTSMYWSSCKNACNSNKRNDGGQWHSDNHFVPQTNGAHEVALDSRRFYVLSASFPDAVVANSFGLDRDGTCGNGYLRLCEAIVFADKTNSTARAELIHDYLRKKWKGEGGYIAPDVTLESIALDNGAELTLDTDGGAITALRLTGSGSLTATGGITIDGDEQYPYAYTARFSANDVCTHLDVAGALALPAYATVSLLTDGGVLPEPGFYPIITASPLSASILNWKLDLSGATRARAYRLQRNGDSIGILVTPVGFSVSFE